MGINRYSAKADKQGTQTPWHVLVGKLFVVVLPGYLSRRIAAVYSQRPVGPFGEIG